MHKLYDVRISYRDGMVEEWRTTDPWEFYQVTTWLDSSPKEVASFEYDPHNRPTRHAFDPNSLSKSYEDALADAGSRGWSFKWTDFDRTEGRVPIRTYLVDAMLNAGGATQLLTGRSWTRNSAAHHVLGQIASYELDREAWVQLAGLEAGGPQEEVPDAL